jgi:hypothetical protein
MWFRKVGGKSMALRRGRPDVGKKKRSKTTEAKQRHDEGKQWPDVGKTTARRRQTKRSKAWAHPRGRLSLSMKMKNGFGH